MAAGQSAHRERKARVGFIRPSLAVGAISAISLRITRFAEAPDMITPAYVNLVSQRWTPFVDVTDFEGFDFSEATFAMHIRLYRDAAGPPLVALGNAASNAQGISVTVIADETNDDLPLSSVQIRLNETTLEALLLNPTPATTGKDVELVYDLHITGGGLPKTRWMEGKFIIRAGATQNG